jgi:tagatose-1,6-bisphosphate aldolase non-catalytic subunit AgaZ/GatZ
VSRLPLISAVLPDQHARMRSAELAAVAIDPVRDVLPDYSAACLLQRSAA